MTGLPWATQLLGDLYLADNQIHYATGVFIVITTAQPGRQGAPDHPGPTSLGQVKTAELRSLLSLQPRDSPTNEAMENLLRSR